MITISSVSESHILFICKLLEQTIIKINILARYFFLTLASWQASNTTYVIFIVYFHSANCQCCSALWRRLSIFIQQTVGVAWLYEDAPAKSMCMQNTHFCFSNHMGFFAYNYKGIQYSKWPACFLLLQSFSSFYSWLSTRWLDYDGSLM